jgi:hypothetical protein
MREIFLGKPPGHSSFPFGKDSFRIWPVGFITRTVDLCEIGRSAFDEGPLKEKEDALDLDSNAAAAAGRNFSSSKALTRAQAPARRTPSDNFASSKVLK